MNVYVDSSVLLRVAFGEHGVLATWSSLEQPISSELIRIECLRTVDRARVTGRLSEPDTARIRADLIGMIVTFKLIPLSEAIMSRAAEPFPTMLGTLDALHLSSALLAREQVEDLCFATHDRELGIAARSVGFDVLA